MVKEKLSVATTFDAFINSENAIFSFLVTLLTSPLYSAPV